MTRVKWDFREYFVWLTELIDLNSDEHEVYSMLIKDLHRKTFYPITDGDRNRADDGVKLRELYCDESTCDGFNYKHFNDDPCSLLEMLIGLAKRINDYILEMSVPYWFWLMIANLGLDILTDDEMLDGGWSVLDAVCDRLINKTYNRNGRGGLFPLPNLRKNVRKLDIWEQMNLYINYNYPT